MSDKEQSKHPKLDPATQDAWNYLAEVVGDYEAFLGNIGDLGYSAPQLLYYRDEVQEFLEDLTGHPQLDLTGVWKKVNDLDLLLRKRAQDVVDEIGHGNFLQYQIINDPPKAHWWWWLNRVTAPPPPPPKVWEFWKHLAQPSKQEDPAPTQGNATPSNPEIAKIFEDSSDA